jgi:hypothetical protein
MPHATNTAERIAAIQNTVGSILGLAGSCIGVLLTSFPFQSPESHVTA